MTPQRLLQTAIIPALAELAARGIPDTQEARWFLLAIAMQESGLRHRRQVTSSGEEDGPAASFWQFERGGACKGLFTHPTAAPHMRAICDAYNVGANSTDLWDAMRYNDIVAACAARLLIYTLPSKLPVSTSQGWTQYLDAWRPGKPRLADWADNWSIALAAMDGEHDGVRYV